jgi:hypothetical protein
VVSVPFDIEIDLTRSTSVLDAGRKKRPSAEPEDVHVPPPSALPDTALHTEQRSRG